MPSFPNALRAMPAPKPLVAAITFTLASLIAGPVAAAGATPAAATVRASVPLQARLQAARSFGRHALPRRNAPLPAATRGGATLPVTSCADDGSSGTLRSVVAGAASGDTVDLSGLSCSSITLTQGAISTHLDSLTLHGPATPLALDGGDAGSVLTHYGAGTLRIERLTITNGYYQGGGGCLFSQASITLVDTAVRDCHSSDQYGAGAGVLARGDLTLESSTLSGNSGAVAGGGAVADGVVTIRNSTISGNTAAAVGGGLYHGGDAASGATLTVTNSTITGNTASYGGGGVYLAYAPATTLRSTIIAGNTASSGADLGSGEQPTVTGDHNLIVATAFALPGDTLTADPQLLPLADNGGPTQTHALATTSPARDAGSNADALAYDQRGAGFARSVGGGPDIGAFELQGSDLIFADGFETVTAP